MTEQERIEGINSEQLATATDRLLLAARFGRARPSSQLSPRGSSPRLYGEYARGSTPHLYSNGLYAPQTDAPLYAPQTDAPLYAPQTDAPLDAPQTPARGSSPQIHVRAISNRNDEHTVFTRRPKHYKAAWRTFATISLVTSLISVATAIALFV